MDNSALLSTNQIILTFIAFFCVFFFALILKKIYYRFVNKKRYFLFPKLDIKGITSVAMIISITVAVLLLLIGISGGFMGIIFRSYPAFRVTIEGILIKIGGLIFGPVIGIFIGALTDLLSIFLTAGMFHYGYFFAAICFGFFSGIINTLLTVSKFNMTKFMAFSMAFIGVCLASCCLFIWTIKGDVFEISIISLDLKFPKIVIIIFLIVFVMIFAIILWICYAISRRDYIKMLIFKNRIKYSKNSEKINLVAEKQLKFFTKNKTNLDSFFSLTKNNSRKNDWFANLSSVIVLALTGELLINIILLPSIDAQMTGMIPMTFMLLERIVEEVVFVMVDILIVFPIYRIVTVFAKFNNEENLSEYLNVQLTEENAYADSNFNSIELNKKNDKVKIEI